ncbi:hypothetical protein PR048_003641 [Dryococelus australis]|uniref:Uncharacterized protein n=1 Tax=Dryococelus australis TaxID=614101 RepID=A0ABQ9IPL7_9NEOP|nr:hypothetical protein PR048_003641 [Dryococelus australis]
MKQRRNESTGETGFPRQNPPTSGIVRHDSPMRKSGSDPAGDRTRFALIISSFRYIDILSNIPRIRPLERNRPRHFVYGYLSVLWHQRTNSQFLHWLELFVCYLSAMTNYFRSRLRKPALQELLPSVSGRNPSLNRPRSRNNCSFAQSPGNAFPVSRWHVKPEARFSQTRAYKPMRVIEMSKEQRRNERAGKREIPEKNPLTNVTRLGIEPGSPWWQASRLTARPPWSLHAVLIEHCSSFESVAFRDDGALDARAVSPLSLPRFSAQNAEPMSGNVPFPCCNHFKSGVSLVQFRWGKEQCLGCAYVGMQPGRLYFTADNHLMTRDVYPPSSPIHAPLCLRLTWLSTRRRNTQT